MTWLLALQIAEGAAAVVGVATGGVASTRWLRGRFLARSTAQPPSVDFELVPLWFELDLVSTRARVVVYAQAINFTRRKILLRSANIRALTAMQTYINRIPLNDPYTLPARRATMITFDRDVLEPELSELRRVAMSHSVFNDGAIAVTAEWKGWRTRTYSTLGDLRLVGRIRRPRIDPNDDKERAVRGLPLRIDG